MGLFPLLSFPSARAGAVRNCITLQSRFLFRQDNELAAVGRPGLLKARACNGSTAASEAIFSRVKDSEDDNFLAHELISKQVLAEAEFANFPRIELAQPRTSPGKAHQC